MRLVLIVRIDVSVLDLVQRQRVAKGIVIYTDHFLSSSLTSITYRKFPANLMMLSFLYLTFANIMLITEAVLGSESVM